MEKWAAKATETGWAAAWVEGAIFPRELAAFLAVCEQEGVDSIIECGRQDGYSTRIVAEYCRARGGRVISIDLELEPARAAACRQRLADLDNIDYRTGDAFELFGCELAALGALARPFAVLMDGPKGFQAMSLLLAATDVEHLRVVAEHNLDWGSREQRLLTALSSGPTHYEEIVGAGVGPAWSRLASDELAHSQRSGAARRLDRSSLGILVLDDATRRRARRAASPSFALQQPPLIRALWRRGRYRDVARLARLSFGLQRRAAALSRTVRRVH